MTYTPPVSQFKVLLDHVVGYGAVSASARFADADDATAAAILEEAGRLAADRLAPLRRDGDRIGARVENGVVRMPEGFASGWQAIAEGGWIGLAADPVHGGMGLPQTLAACVSEMFAGACLSLQIAPLLTQGQIEALEAHADPALQALALPRLISGEWSGTMNLTEPQAGSDVGAVRSTATPLGDGRYAVRGQKIYISYGDHDMVENVCHLVLARLPDAPRGTRGLSLFWVPKRLPDPDGRLREANGVRLVGLEEKLGLHASPTATLSYEDATGWLVVAPDWGMAAMFTMLNFVRLAVASQGTGVADAALQAAKAYAADRVQGGQPIAAHADVRRMIAAAEADVFAARALGLMCGVAIDRARAEGVAPWQARAGLLTPLAKAFCTDVGVAVADQAIQVFGGMGYVEETGVAQYWRDVRVATIYEGTNGIQAIDLVGRKLADDGEAAVALIAEVRAEATRAPAALGPPVVAASDRALAATRAMLRQPPGSWREAGGVAYLRGLARLVGAQSHLRAAATEAHPGPRTALARVYLARALPELTARFTEAVAGDGDLQAWVEATA